MSNNCTKFVFTNVCISCYTFRYTKGVAMLMTQTLSAGKYIAQRRKRIGLTQESFAKLIDRAPSTVAGWEVSGLVPLELIPEIARVLEEKSPVKLYEAAGILANLPAAELIKMLDGASSEDIHMVVKLARALLQKENH